jgi:dimethylglycine dehydrogenase
MLNPQGRIVGEFSVSRIGDDEFFLFGSQAAEVHHPRWFLDHLPAGSPIRFEVLSLSMVGLTVAGPRSRDVLQKLTDTNRWPRRTSRSWRSGRSTSAWRRCGSAA